MSKFKTLDIAGVREYLESEKEFQRHIKSIKEKEAEQYYKGYCDAIHSTLTILEASNFEIKNESEDGE